jgi:ubiquinone/menaquinone biosynthesis C-methylase UbiE
MAMGSPTGPLGALREMHRVLKPGGRALRVQGSKLRRVQGRNGAWDNAERYLTKIEKYPHLSLCVLNNGMWV